MSQDAPAPALAVQPPLPSVELLGLHTTAVACADAPNARVQRVQGTQSHQRSAGVCCDEAEHPQQEREGERAGKSGRPLRGALLSDSTAVSWLCLRDIHSWIWSGEDTPVHIQGIADP